MNAKPGVQWQEKLGPARESQHVVLSYEEDLKTPILDVIKQVLKFWRVVACLAIAGGAAGIGIALIVPKQYVINAQYSFTADEASGGAFGGLKSRLGGIASLAGVELGPGGASHAEIVAALRSEAFIRGFIGDNNLLPILFKNKWNPTVRKWKSAEDEPSLAMGYLRFTGRVLKITEDKTTSLLRVSARWTDPDMAKIWIDRLVMKLNESLRKRAMERADQNLKFLLQEMQETQTVELSQALYGLVEAETRQKMMAKVNSSYALREVDPPIVPDPDGFTSPKKAIFALLGGVLGFFFGVMYAVTRTFLTKHLSIAPT